jgi:hypothetical protein
MFKVEQLVTNERTTLILMCCFIFKTFPNIRYALKPQ